MMLTHSKNTLKKENSSTCIYIFYTEENKVMKYENLLRTYELIYQELVKY